MAGIQAARVDRTRNHYAVKYRTIVFGLGVKGTRIVILQYGFIRHSRPVQVREILKQLTRDALFDFY